MIANQTATILQRNFIEKVVAKCESSNDDNNETDSEISEKSKDRSRFIANCNHPEAKNKKHNSYKHKLMKDGD